MTGGRCWQYAALAAPKCAMSVRYRCTNRLCCHVSPRAGSMSDMERRAACRAALVACASLPPLAPLGLHTRCT